MIDDVALQVSQMTDSSAAITLAGVDGASAAALGSEIHGPRCACARTLPSTFRPLSPAASEATQFLITEPCYWTPQLPFLYDLRLKWRHDDGSIGELERPIGLRRLTVQGSNLRLNGERIVLRGARCMGASDDVLAEAHAAEMALLTDNPNDGEFESTAEQGVFLAVDVEQASSEKLRRTLIAATWQPAIAMLMLNGPQIAAHRSSDSRQMNLLIAQQLQADDRPTENELDPNVHLIAINLASGQRPPGWMTKCGKPVIAIRREEIYADFHAARAACDRLQAELAPEFDLAGYFVR